MVGNHVLQLRSCVAVKKNSDLRSENIPLQMKILNTIQSVKIMNHGTAKTVLLLLKALFAILTSSRGQSKDLIRLGVNIQADQGL